MRHSCGRVWLGEKLSRVGRRVGKGNPYGDGVPLAVRTHGAAVFQIALSRRA